MKIIHLSDIHIGTKFNEIEDNEKKELLKYALIHSFSKVIDYAKENNIYHILLSGDVFDNNVVNKKNKEYFYNVITANKDITFYYLKGNHDLKSKYLKEIDNLKTFDSGIEKYHLGENVYVYGYELKDNNSLLYNLDLIYDNCFNIFMLHGDIFNSSSNVYIDINKLKKKNINYFALGHIHKRKECKLDFKTNYVYPGCLMGRGFDELDDKGFYVIDTNNLDNPFLYVHLNNYEFKKIEVDVSNVMNIYELEELIKDKIIQNKLFLYQIVLKGKVSFEIDEKQLVNIIKDYVFYVEIKNNTFFDYTLETNYNDNLLIDLFVKKVNMRNELSEEEKNEIISYGIKKIEKEVK